MSKNTNDKVGQADTCKCGKEYPDLKHLRTCTGTSKPADAEMEKASEIQADVLHDDEYHGTHYKDRIAELHVKIDRQALEIKALQAANQMFVEYEKRVEKQLKAKDAEITKVLECLPEACDIAIKHVFGQVHRR